MKGKKKVWFSRNRLKYYSKNITLIRTIFGFVAPVLDPFRQLFLTQYFLDLLLCSICYTAILAVAPATSYITGAASIKSCT